MIGFRQCDPRWPFLRSDVAQPAARWHSLGESPGNYFADTAVGAWAELLRHEEIKDADDLAGVRRSLWPVEIPETGNAAPMLPNATLRGNRLSYPACQSEAKTLRTFASHRGLPTTARGRPAYRANPASVRSDFNPILAIKRQGKRHA